MVLRREHFYWVKKKLDTTMSRPFFLISLKRKPTVAQDPASDNALYWV